MGIDGLKGFLAKTRPSSHTPIFFSPNSPQAEIVIDASSLAFYLTTGTDLAKGGDYVQIEQTLNAFFDALKRFNLEPFLVWDGPRIRDRLLNVSKNRLESKVASSRAYWRASDVLRSDSSFIRDNSVHPSFTTSVLKRVARDRGIPQKFPNSTEADALISTIAQERYAFILSNDSDFFVLPHAKGYINWESFYWHVPSPRNSEDDEDGWKTITRHHFGDTHSSIFEKIVSAEFLEALVYKSDLSELLSIPHDLLDFFAVLVGTDALSFETLFAPTRRTRLSRSFDRIQVVAILIQQNSRMDSLRSLYEKIILDICEQSQSQKTVDEVLEMVLDAMQKYHYFPDCSAGPFPQNHEDQTAIVEKLNSLYESGHLKSSFVEPFTQGISFLPVLMEDPDQKSVHEKFQKVRGIAYAKLINAFSPATPSSNDDSESLNGFWIAREVQMAEYYKRGNHFAGILLTRADLLAFSNCYDSVQDNLEVSTSNSGSMTDKNVKLFYHLLNSENLIQHSTHILSPFIAVLRYVIRTDDRPKPWTDHERRSAIAMAVLASDFRKNNKNNSMRTLPVITEDDSAARQVPKKDHLQRGAQLNAGLYSCSFLASSLFLHSTFLDPSLYYDGTLFHLLLQSQDTDKYVTGDSENDFHFCLNALAPGLPQNSESRSLEARAKKKKKKKEEKEKAEVIKESSNVYNILGDTIA